MYGKLLNNQLHAVWEGNWRLFYISLVFRSCNWIHKHVNMGQLWLWNVLQEHYKFSNIATITVVLHSLKRHNYNWMSSWSWTVFPYYKIKLTLKNLSCNVNGSQSTIRQLSGQSTRWSFANTRSHLCKIGFI